MTTNERCGVEERVLVRMPVSEVSFRQRDDAKWETSAGDQQVDVCLLRRRSDDGPSTFEIVVDSAAAEGRKVGNRTGKDEGDATPQHTRHGDGCLGGWRLACWP